jgi:hypothetical protein
MRVRDPAAVNLQGVFDPIALPGTDAERLLIITFSPGCPICAANQPFLAALARDLKNGRGYRVLWLTRDSIKVTRQHCERNNIPMEDVMAEAPIRTYRQLGLDAVPQMFVVKSGGIIDRAWNGRLNAEKLAEISGYFHTNLGARTFSSGNGRRYAQF